MFTLAKADLLESIYAPLPLTTHVMFCIAATLIFLLQFVRKNYTYYIFFMIAVNLTILSHYIKKPIYILILGVIEIALIVIGFVYMYKETKNSKSQNVESKENESDVNEKEFIEDVLDEINNGENK